MIIIKDEAMKITNNFKVIIKYNKHYGDIGSEVITKALPAVEITENKPMQDGELEETIKITKIDGGLIVLQRQEVIYLKIDDDVIIDEPKRNSRKTNTPSIADRIKPSYTNIYEKIAEIIPFPPSADIEGITQLLKNGMGSRLLCEAVDITLNSDAMEGRPPTEKWKYFRGVICSWQNNGIRTYEEYLEHERKRELYKNLHDLKNLLPQED